MSGQSSDTGDAARAEAGREHRLEDGRQPERDNQAREPAGDTEQDALEQELADDARASRAERAPHRELLLPRHAACEHQSRNIDARDEQHDARDDGEDAERKPALLRSESSPRPPGNSPIETAAISGLMPESTSMLPSVP